MIWHIMNITDSIHSFFRLVQQGEIEIYNEFSLQHELGIYLRKSILKPTKIQFERNVSDFGLTKNKYEKKEMDLIIFNETTASKDMQCAIELKFPRNGQVPESMFNFCKDIFFLEQLMQSGAKSAYFIAVADDKLFYSGQKNDGIYAYFRGGKEITGNIHKPTGKKDYQVHVRGTYDCKWQDIGGNMKYCIIHLKTLPVHH